jgi:hypothetical protein
VTGRHHAGIAPACLDACGLVLLDKHDLVPVLQQFVGSRHSDDAAAHDQNSHADLRLRWRLLDNRR